MPRKNTPPWMATTRQRAGAAEPVAAWTERDLASVHSDSPALVPGRPLPAVIHFALQRLGPRQRLAAASPNAHTGGRGTSYFEARTR